MSVFNPHPMAPPAVRVIRRTMYFQVGLAVIFGGVSASHLGDYNYYQPNKGLLVLQFLLAAALAVVATAIGRLQPWSLPAAFTVEVAALALGLYAFTDTHSGLAAGFIVAGFNLYRLSQSNVQQALKAGPGAPPYEQYGGGQQYGTPYGAQPPYGAQQFGQPPYGTPYLASPQRPARQEPDSD